MAGRAMVNIRPILYVVGLLLLAEGALMALPAMVDAAIGHPDWRTFAIAGFLTLAFGGALATANRPEHFQIGIWQGFLLTTLAWVAVIVFGAAPFMFTQHRLSFTDAVFETTSGFTTTGSTVIVGLDDSPPGILLWRSLIQWIGGLGIVVMGIIMLPFLRVGGMQLFRTESSDRSEKMFPRPAQLSLWLATAYLGLTFACAVCLRIAGMGWFDAVNHALTTLSTGGFSNKDASVGFYDNAGVDWVLVVFMAAGALPLSSHSLALRRGPRTFLADTQVGTFLALLVASILVITLWVWLSLDQPFGHALRLAAFNVTSIISTTGFATTDYGKWGSFAVGGFFLFYFFGACAGSTGGAVKIFRWQILYAALRRQFRLMRRPHEVVVVSYNGRAVGEGVMVSVANFFVLYMATFAALSLGVMAFDVDFLSAVSGVAQAMANAGPGLGPIVGPAGNFAPLPAGAKWLLSFAMLLGRLELFTVYAVLIPGLWRHD
ncbi:MAG TPA: TrkH family potassium uptake protein [Alphaproteobacteria bacterium]|nr:TrkH family potassium uptake protein [Alphaproteobacteria bacterium]